MKKFRDYVEDILDFYRDAGMEVDPVPAISVDDSDVYRFDPFVPTGSYDFTTNTISLMTGGRQLKDVLRTLCHELVHVHQHRTDPDGYESFDKSGTLESNDELRKYETEAYARGNVLFREWTEARAGRRRA